MFRHWCVSTMPRLWMGLSWTSSVRLTAVGSPPPAPSRGTLRERRSTRETLDSASVRRTRDWYTCCRWPILVWETWGGISASWDLLWGMLQTRKPSPSLTLVCTAGYGCEIKTLYIWAQFYSGGDPTKTVNLHPSYIYTCYKNSIQECIHFTTQPSFFPNTGGGELQSTG